jgi:hypothetical protein
MVARGEMSLVQKALRALLAAFAVGMLSPTELVWSIGEGEWS